MMNLNRTFGVEMEITGLDIHETATVLRNAGIDTYDVDTCSFDGENSVVIGSRGREATWTDEERANRNRWLAAWKVVYDGSVNNGCEVVSPILSGEDGITNVRKVVRILKAAGASVDNSCGFHVHVGASDLSGAELMYAARRYAHYESAIDGFMAPRRRGNESTWCRSMAEVVTRLQNAPASGTAADMANRQGGRYHKLNLTAFVKHGTLEFRQHAGTLNISKMVHWVIFCVNFVESSKLSPEMREAHTATMLRNRQVDVARALMRYQGREVAYWSIASAANLPENSIHAAVEELIENYPAFRFGPIRGVDYWRVPRFTDAPTMAPQPLEMPSVNADPFAVLPDATRAYLEARAQGYVQATQARLAAREARRVAREAARAERAAARAAAQQATTPTP